MPKGQYDHKSLHDRFMQYVDDNWQWVGRKGRDGYGRMGKAGLAHRISFELFKGPIPDGVCVLHSCDDPGCVNPEHLHLGDQKLNMQEMREHGRERKPHGQTHGMAVFTDNQVIDIREKYKQGIGQRALARQYQVSKGTIAFIVHNKTWKHLP